MARLAPPIIEGTIPAFCPKNGTAEIAVPFAMNRAVSREQVKGFKLKIKTISSSTYLTTLDGSVNWKDMEIIFPIDTSLINEGQFYKIQVAYVDISGEIGYYSAVSVVKYTSQPTIKIEGLEESTINHHIQNYVGSYEQSLEGDTTEKVYKYCFTIYDSNKNIFITTGEQIHNSSNDISANHSYDLYDCQYELKFGEVYYIEYKVITINNLVLSSRKYRISQKNSIEPNLNSKITPELNYDNGYISIRLEPKIENGVPMGSNGAFILSRACEDTNFTQWDSLKRIRYRNETAKGEIFKDFTIQQGKTYIYGIAQYSDDGIFSNRKLSQKIYSDFEDAFLYDGEKQLKIKFNPQISSFKADILEQKTDTIGSKYPFIFRNGSVNYKEFPISGLISYLMDEEQLFMTNAELGLTTDIQTRKRTLGNSLDAIKVRTTSLEAYNVMAEREFKLKVLDWLNDGKLKLFRSPTEGNYLVRVMNSTLSPNPTVGRMLHTFSSQAYEMAECNYKNLVDNNIIRDAMTNDVTLKWAFINCADLINSDSETKIVNGEQIQYVKINQYEITTLSLEGLMPGTIIFLDNQPITIGVTGAYYVDNAIKVNAVYVPLDSLNGGNAALNMVYSYYDKVVNVFDNISSIDSVTIPTRQFMSGEDIIKELTTVTYNGVSIPNIKEEISAINRISFFLKEGIGQRLYRKGKNYYTKNIEEALDAEQSSKYIFDLSLLNPYYVYPLYDTTYDENTQDYKFLGYAVRRDEGKIGYKQASSNDKEEESYIKIISGKDLNPTEEILKLNDIQFFSTEYFTDSIPQSIQLGNNVYAEVVYTSNIITYKAEDNAKVKDYKKAWEESIEEFNSDRAAGEINTRKKLQAHKEKINQKYFEFIQVLTKVLEEETEV